jgi:Winged helix-turn-helix DNA-binding
MSLNQLTFAAGTPLFGGLIPPAPKTYASWPVWHDSTTKEVKFQPMAKKQAAKTWHKARRFERQSRKAGRQDGALGRNGIAILQVLLFDFLNYASGALYPSYAAIAEKANISLSSVWRGLKKLKEAGVVNWLRRCGEEWIDGRFTLRQDTNAYAVLPPSQWIGYSVPPPAPPPEAGTWGDHPPLPSALGLAVIVGREGGDLTARIAALESDDSDPLARALAGLGRAMRG